MTDWVQPIPDLIDPLGLTGRLAGQWMFLPAVGAAFIMQGMHPVIGDVTDRYSVADRDPAGRAIRSFDATQQWSYGGKAAIEQGYWLRRMHRPLQMTAETGDQAGKHISALDPSAYGWVIATAYATTVRVAPLFLGRALTDAELDEIFADNVRLARITQVPERGYPTSRAEFDDYYRHMVDEVLIAHPALVENLDRLAAPTAAVSKADLGGLPSWIPRGPALAAIRRLDRPLSRFTHALTFGAMDERVRGILGVEWTDGDERYLERLFRLYRFALRVLPERVTYSPLAYHARAHERVIRAMRRRELRDFTAHDKGEPSAVRRAARRSAR
ncbi:MAG: oxygenase MpaB family protein [Gordonia sp. (in: high G+C Gram-positive bacteria)]|uniref:oxygenase MpaB family protein n=1 Tax=Gordonia sp. (in: high G+C Gram-positive bacteria) TaxID=84139 RepID=UPI0039E2E3F4